MDPASLSVSPLADVAVSVVHGAADAISPVAVAQDLRQRLPAAHVVMVPDGSHMLPNTHPEPVRDDLVRLVRRTGDSCRQSAS